MSKATGVPPHVAQLNLMTLLLELCQTTLQRVNDQEQVVRESIFTAMEQRAIENGHITSDQIVNILDNFRKGIQDNVKMQLSKLQQHGIGPNQEQAPPMNNNPTVGNNPGNLFLYSGKFWDVPQNFQFPKGLKRHAGWKLLWLHGMPGHSVIGENGVLGQKPIKPFCTFVPGRLPKNC